MVYFCLIGNSKIFAQHFVDVKILPSPKFSSNTLGNFKYKTEDGVVKVEI